MSFNPSMLTLAREARGLTQSELAALTTTVGQSALSKYENGVKEPTEAHIEAIAKALRFQRELFYREDRLEGPASTCIYHRKRQSASVQAQKRIHALANLLRIQIARLLRGAEVGSDFPFPVMNVEDYEGGAEEVAQNVRAVWRLPRGPVANLVSLIERAGGVVVPFSFGTRQIDAISQWPKNLVPLIYTNSDMAADRGRHNLAHELGHLVMHAIPTPNLEDEANAFAAEFLMPAHDIRPDLIGLTLPRLATLKSYWRVSMKNLVYRAHTLGCISDYQNKRLNIELNRLMVDRSEPATFEAEEPSVLRDLVDVHLNEHGYTTEELCKVLDLVATESDFYDFFQTHKPRGLRVI